MRWFGPSVPYGTRATGRHKCLFGKRGSTTAHLWRSSTGRRLMCPCPFCAHFPTKTGQHASESAESALGFSRRLQRRVVAGLRNMGSYSSPPPVSKISRHLDGIEVNLTVGFPPILH